MIVTITIATIITKNFNDYNNVNVNNSEKNSNNKSDNISSNDTNFNTFYIKVNRLDKITVTMKRTLTKHGMLVYRVVQNKFITLKKTN